MKKIFFLIFVFLFSFSFSQEKVSKQIINLSLEITIHNDSIKLPGTLSYEPEFKKQPLVIIVHGSGPVDRNGNSGFLQANSYKKLSEELNKNGIATFCYDKGASLPENLKYLKNITFDFNVKDVNAVINHFTDDKRFSEIILIGHSEGSLVSILTAENNSKVKKLISLAGAARPIDQIMVEQVSAQSQPLADELKKSLEELKSTGKIEKYNPMLGALLNESVQPYILSWMKITPSEEIKKLKIPVLLVNGTKDKQVKVSEAEALHKAYPKSELAIIPNMTHVLKDTDTDDADYKTYTDKTLPVSPELVKAIVSFIKK